MEMSPDISHLDNGQSTTPIANHKMKSNVRKERKNLKSYDRMSEKNVKTQISLAGRQQSP